MARSKTRRKLNKKTKKMKEKEFEEKLGEKIPELVYSDSLLDNQSMEIPIYFMVDDDGDVKIDEEGIREEFESKLKDVLNILNN